MAVLVGCGGSTGSEVPDLARPDVSTTPAEEPSAVPSAVASAPPTRAAPPPGSVPPAWLGTRVLPRTASGFGEQRPTPPELRNRRFTLPDTLPALPGSGFVFRISDPAPTSVIRRSTWAPGCPVAASDLAWIRLAFWGFDQRRHTGELLVNSAAANDLVGVFRALYAARHPIEQMRISTRADLDAPPTGDGNNTEGFVCRPTTGGTSFSQHAYGLAIDLDPFQNPYIKGDLVLPELAGSYLDRSRVRAGMILANDAVVQAFRRIGWQWGGDWRTLKDYQHFSQNGR